MIDYEIIAGLQHQNGDTPKRVIKTVIQVNWSKNLILNKKEVNRLR